MNSLKKGYYYLFYQIYKLGPDSGPFSRKYSSQLLMIVLETAFVISLNCYYIEFFDHNGRLNLYSIRIILPVLAIFILNNIVFDKDEKWKGYIEEFDKWPKNKNIIGSVIVILFIGFIFYSIQYSLSTMRQISANRQNNIYSHKDNK